MDQKTRITSVIHNVKNKLQLLTPQLDQLALSGEPDAVAASQNLRRGMAEINQELVALLGFERLEETSQLSIGEPVYIQDLLLSVASYADGLCEVDLACDPSLNAYCDETLVKIVVSDAVHNAVKYCDSKILLRAEKLPAGLRICVEDDGPGFEADVTLENLAEAERHEPRLNTGGDTGLGIALARKVAEAHVNQGQFGSIKLSRSTHLGGAAFELRLP